MEKKNTNILWAPASRQIHAIILQCSWVMESWAESNYLVNRLYALMLLLATDVLGCSTSERPTVQSIQVRAKVCVCVFAYTRLYDYEFRFGFLWWTSIYSGMYVHQS